MFGFIPNIGFPELILILVLALIIFGPSKIPEIGKGLGKGIKEFRSASEELLMDRKDLKSENKEERKDEAKEV